MNHQFAHNDFIDGIVVVLSKLPNKYWIAKESNKTAHPMLQNTLTPSTTSILSIPSTTPSMVLPDHPLPHSPLIRMSNTSSASSSKCNLELEDNVNSQSVKRCSQVSGTTGSHSGDQSFVGTLDSDSLAATSSSWAKVDPPSCSETPNHVAGA